MTKEETRGAAKLMLAWASVSEIEFCERGPREWFRLQNEPCWNFEHRDYRIKPETKMVPWDCPEDVPLNCWVSMNEGRMSRSLIASVSADGRLQLAGGSSAAYAELFSQSWKWSTDGKTWYRCGKVAE